MENFAVIDLGSSSARMTITAIQADGTYQVVRREKAMVRLSENMNGDRMLQQPAMERTLATLNDFQTIYQELPNVKIKALATAAVRMAKNKKDFLKQVSRVAPDLNLEVIPGTQEAHYDFLGVINTLPVANCLIMDTGGASCELILVQNSKAQHLISLPIGSVNLTERFFGQSSDVIKAADLFRAYTFMNQLFNGVWWLHKAQNLPIVALGGSNRTLAKIQRKRSNFLNFEDIHGYHMTVPAADDIYADIVSKDYAARKKIPGLAKERADIIAAGLTPLVAMTRYLDSDRITFSQNGLREGVLFEHLSQLQEQGKVD
jgi:exopolyphosphatase/guanosine-5'-triphosphate,3'-diphosphate pyrophosphatase